MHACACACGHANTHSETRSPRRPHTYAQAMHARTHARTHARMHACVDERRFHRQMRRPLQPKIGNLRLRHMRTQSLPRSCIAQLGSIFTAARERSVFKQ
eukprot:1729962-Pleurochrysis_carterae.AAC.1